MGARDLLKSAVAAYLVVATAGCAIYLPPSAVKVQEKDVRFLQQGATSRDEVLHKLGPPNILDGKLVSVYEWRTERGTLFVGGGGPGGGGAAGIETGSNHSRLLVGFDEDGTLRHFAFAEYRYPGLFFKEPEPPGNYFVDGSAREMPTPAAPLLQPSRSLGGGDGQSLALLLSQNPYEALAISRDVRYVAVAPATGGIRSGI
jgi:outer membrane protein assembly factor BamE (lipoprotein component of BamABCDE complex)